MGKYDFGNYICKLREEKGLTQSALGELLGVTNKAVSRWENGSAYPSTDLMLPLANALGVPIENLYRMISDGKLPEGAISLQEEADADSNGSIEQEASQAEAPISLPLKKRKLAVWLVLSASLLVISATVVAALLWLLPSKKPLQRTAEAVFPFLSVLFDMENGGSVTLQGELGKDVLPSIEQERAEFSVSYDFKKGKERLNLQFGHKAAQSAVTAFGNGERYALTSQSLLGDETLFVDRDGLMEKLDASVFSPNGSSKYAITMEQYEQIREALEKYDRERAEYLKDTLNDAVSNVEKRVKDQRNAKTKRETVLLLNGASGAWVTTTEMNEEFLLALIDAIKAEWQENQEFRSAVETVYRDAGLAELIPLEKTFSQTVEELLDALRKTVAESDPVLTVRTAQKSGYLVLFELHMETVDRSNPKKPCTVKQAASFVTNRSPKRDPGFELSFKETVNDVTEMEMKGSYVIKDEGKHSFSLFLNDNGAIKSAMRFTFDVLLEKQGRMEMEASLKQAMGYSSIDKAKYEELLHLKAEGSYAQARKKIDLGITSAKLKLENTTWEISKSEIHLLLSAKKPRGMRMMKCTTELTSISTEQAARLFDTVQQNLQQFSKQLNESIGTELLRFEYQAKENRREMNTSGSFGFDEKSGFLFLMHTINQNYVRYEPKLYVFRSGDLSLVKKVDLPQEYRYSQIRVNNGKILFVPETGRKVFIHDAATVTLEKTVTLPYKPSDIILDGDVLLLFNYDKQGLYRIDLLTDETRKLDSFEHPVELFFSQKDHTVMAYCSFWDYQISKQLSCVSIYSTETGERLSQYVFQSGSSGVCFNGSVFVVGNRVLSAETGKELNAAEVLPSFRSNTYYPWVEESVYMSYDYFKKTFDVYLKAPDYTGTVGSVSDTSDEVEVFRVSDGRYLILHDPSFVPSVSFASDLRIRRVWKMDSWELVLP